MTLEQDSTGSENQLQMEHIEALYQLNIEAKRYKKEADTAYELGRGKRAKIHSLRKKALYSLKDEILHQWVTQASEEIDSISRHTIDDREYLCFYVRGYSFHSALEHWDEQLLPAVEDSETTELTDFDADPESRESLMSERKALETLTAYNSPNYYLDPVFIDSATFVGWEYLPGTAEQGQKVDENHLSSELKVESHQFDVGDMLIDYRRNNSPMEIISKYYMWWGSLQMAAYDARCVDDDGVVTIEEGNLPNDISATDHIEVLSK